MKKFNLVMVIFLLVFFSNTSIVIADTATQKLESEKKAAKEELITENVKLTTQLIVHKIDIQILELKEDMTFHELTGALSESNKKLTKQEKKYLKKRIEAKNERIEKAVEVLKETKADLINEYVIIDMKALDETMTTEELKTIRDSMVDLYRQCLKEVEEIINSSEQNKTLTKKLKK